MHIHSAAANPAGNSLAGAALAAETALATRRAQELRDAGRKLRAASLESGLQFADQLPPELQTGAQSPAASLTVVANHAGSDQSALASAESFAQRFAGDLQLERPSGEIQEVKPATESAPVSYWA